MLNDKGIWGMLLVLAVLALPFLLPQNAAAYQINQPQTLGQADPNTGITPVCPGSGLTSRLILCVRDTVIFTSTAVLADISKFFAKTIAAACTLAIMLWGIKVMASGRPTTITRDGVVLGLKIAGVLVFTANFDGLFPILLDVLEYTLTIIAVPAINLIPAQGCAVLPHAGSEVAIMRVWDVIDCYLDKLIGGIYSPISLSFGIVGLLVGLIVSSSIGLFIALMGFYMISAILLAIARTLYVFVTAYIAFSLMVIISPIFIPLILFQYTKGIFEKWLKLTIGFLIQPIFLFGFLVMFLVAFDSTLYSGKYSLYHAIAGDAAAGPDFKLGKWLEANKAYSEQSLMSRAMNVNPAQACTEANAANKEECQKREGVDTGIADTQGRVKTNESDWVVDGAKKGIFSALGVDKVGSNFFKTDIPVRAVDWEALAKASGKPDLQSYQLALLLAFLMGVVTIYIFYTMIQHIPFVGSGITGEGMGVPALGTGKLAPPGMRGRK